MLPVTRVECADGDRVVSTTLVEVRLDRLVRTGEGCHE